MTGIVSYATYIPRLRLKVKDVAAFWNKNPDEIEFHLGIIEKSVAEIDEDTTTMAIEAAYLAISRQKINPSAIGAIMIGSESHPYSVKPTSTIVGDVLNLENDYLALDTEFACKAATASIPLVDSLVETKKIKYGLVIGSDTAQAKPGDPLEYTAAAASAALIIGNTNPLTKLIGFASYSSDTPDFWRRDSQKYPSHGGRFTGEPAYFAHIISASNLLFKKYRLKPQYFDYAVFHMPNSKFPKEAAKRLGFTAKQIAPGFIVNKIGNPYSASSLIGLCATLDIAKPKQRIFVCSYGSGAGSDAFVFETTENLKSFQKIDNNKVTHQIASKNYTDYPHFLKITKSRNYDL